MKKTKKYLAITSSSVLALSLVGCGVEHNVEVGNEQTVEQTAEEYANQVLASELKSVEDSEFAKDCSKWERREDGSFYCNDEGSEYYGNYFFNGVLFGTLGSMLGSSLYKNNNLVNGLRKQNIINSYNTDRERSHSSGVVAPASGGAKSDKGSNNSTSKGNNSNSSNTSKGGSSTSPSGGKSGFGSGGSSFGGSSSS